MRLSVVIPCYNAGAFLGEAIESVFAQSRAPDEIIVVDDCSTDDSAAVAHLLGVVVVRTPRNIGSAGARNLGLRTAQGELVAWLDADDLWEPDHLETVVQLLDAHPEAVLAFSRARRFGSATGEWPATLPAGRPVSALDACLAACPLPQNAVVVRRAAVLAAGSYDENLRIAEDYDLWLRLALDHAFVCTHRVTVGWRQHAGQTSSAGLVPYWRQEYESRARFLERIRTSEEPELVTRVETQMLSVWESHLWNAWHSRRADHLRFHLSMRHFVPGAEAILDRWRIRRQLMRILPVTDRIRAFGRRGDPRVGPRVAR